MQASDLDKVESMSPTFLLILWSELSRARKFLLIFIRIIYIVQCVLTNHSIQWTWLRQLITFIMGEQIINSAVLKTIQTIWDSWNVSLQTLKIHRLSQGHLVHAVSKNVIFSVRMYTVMKSCLVLTVLVGCQFYAQGKSVWKLRTQISCGDIIVNFYWQNILCFI